MRIAFVTYDFAETGGQGRFSQGLVSELQTEGVDVEVISPHLTADWFSKTTTRIGRGAGFSIALNFNLPAILRAGRFDLIHLNSGPGGVLLPRHQPLPLIATSHHTYAQQSRLVGGQRWKAAFGFIERISLRHAHSVAADTPSTAASLLDEYGLKPERVSVIPCGLDFGVFRPASTRKQPNTCLFVGRLDARKGFSHLLHAWQHVVRRFPDSRLTVIGNGPEKHAAELFLATAGISHTVSFLRGVDTSELVRRYSEAQCVTVPSVFEGFGLAALEALASGTRVVARNVEGLRDVIDSPSFGTLVPPDDPEAFAGAIIAEFEQPQTIDTETRARLEQRYAWPVVARRYLVLYRETLRAAAARPVTEAGNPSQGQGLSL